MGEGFPKAMEPPIICAARLTGSPVGSVETLLIGAAVFDRARAELRRADDGSPLRVRPQSLKVLEILAENAGRLVTREALNAAVWPNVVVTEDSLVQCVAEIRRAIGDSRHELLRTVPRRGYCLETATPTAASGGKPAGLAPARPRRWIALAGLGAAAGLAILLSWPRQAPAPEVSWGADVVRPALAVLPFRGDGADGQSDALGAGLAEDLAVNLARDVDLRIIATRSSFAVERTLAPVTMARQLGVRYLIDGKVRHRDDALELNVQLLDGVDGRIVWTDVSTVTAQTLSRERQALITRIGASVQASMRRNQKEAARNGEPGRIDAYVLTLRAYANKHRYTPEAYRSARADLERALQLDPNHAAAWAGLGYLNGIDAINRITGEWTMARLPEALQQLDRGLAIDATLSVVHQARAIVFAAMQRFDEALSAAEQAARLAPGDPDNLMVLAKAQTEAGRVADGLRTMQQALSLYPIEPVYVSFLAAHVLWANARHDDAIAKATLCVERAPRFVNCRITLASALFEAGRLAQAQAEAEQIRQLLPTATSKAFSNLFAGVQPLRERRIVIAQALGFAPAR
jgi:DNA-binding winged helix-turn-helix (wHTH) protein/TolB-like protein/cytochrome c-type biogenesis protein CcmH/NrfG